MKFRNFLFTTLRRNRQSRLMPFSSRYKQNLILISSGTRDVASSYLVAVTKGFFMKSNTIITTMSTLDSRSSAGSELAIQSQYKSGKQSLNGDSP